MITTSSRTGSNKPSGLILPLIVPVERKDIMRISAQKQTTGPQESILRDKLAFIHIRISTLETTLEDIQISSESSRSKTTFQLHILVRLKSTNLPTTTSTSSNTTRANQDNTLRINRGTRYDIQRTINVDQSRENVARKCQKLKRAKDATYHKEKMLLRNGKHIILTIGTDSRGSLQNAAINLEHIFDMSTNGDQADHDDDDLARERNLLASLIEKLKCETEDNKNRNKFLESSN
ncbi:hypothetical protein Tco_0820372 [Tanacetum coccineum]|uniref:Uncharacterized protein n=1 Tax=Tanacetum coccineum TaxID=301880 RepID=A0ABQ5AD95_9ASTR